MTSRQKPKIQIFPTLKGIEFLVFQVWNDKEMTFINL